MLGAILGDVIGSPYEFNSGKVKNFPLFDVDSRLTDDSLMTIAVGCAVATADLTNEAHFKQTLTRFMREIGRLYPSAGYGEKFYKWIFDDSMGAYGSFGNGSAMRVSPVAWAAESLEEAEQLAAWSAEVTHDHPDGVRGAQAVAAAIYLAREGGSKEAIRDYVHNTYYALDFTLDAIRADYRFDVTCRGSVPQAIVAFLEARDFEDAVRNAVSLGGDGDTQAAIAGAIAEAFFGIPDALQEKAFSYMDDTVTDYYFTYADQLYGY